MFGNEGYSESQEQHCTCVSKKAPPAASTSETDAPAVQLTAAEAHYVQLVDDFYTKHAPDSSRKLSSEELVLSYSRTKKLPLYRLYYDLHKKYDKAIKHVDGRKNRDPPRPPAKVKKPQVVDESTVEPIVTAEGHKEL
jgi:hypothetical protein